MHDSFKVLLKINLWLASLYFAVILSCWSFYLVYHHPAPLSQFTEFYPVLINPHAIPASHSLPLLVVRTPDSGNLYRNIALALLAGIGGRCGSGLCANSGEKCACSSPYAF